MISLDLVRATRREQRLTQAEVAAMASISIPALLNLERSTGSLSSLKAAMNVLGLHWGWTTDYDRAAQVLAERRKAKHLTQQDLALRVGCSRPTIIALEQNLIGSVTTLLAVLSALSLRPALRAAPLSKGRGLVPATNNAAQDIVMTPPDLAAAVIAHFAPQMAGTILDPAKGAGAFFDRFPAHMNRHWCEVANGRDFLSFHDPVDWIVTNPPWSKLREFTRHAMTVASDIVWLVPMTNLTTKARLRDLDEHGFGIVELLFIDTPKSWPQSGFQLVAAHLRKGHAGVWKISRLDVKAA